MTRPDFLNAIRRYAERQERANIKTDTVYRNQAVLRDFLREVETDIERDPGLFQHPELYAKVSTIRFLDNDAKKGPPNASW